jgi:hypothetical protein
MDALCQLVASRSGVFQRNPDLFLVSTALTSQVEKPAGGFAIFVKDGAEGRYRLQDGSNGSATRGPTSAPAQAASEQIAVILGADFEAWGELRDCVDDAGFQGEMTVLMLVPTGEDPMAQVSLAQFVTEASIRSQAFGFAGEMQVAARCGTAELGVPELNQAVCGTLLGKLLDSLVPETTDQVAIVASRVEPLPLATTAHAPLFTVLTRTQGTRMETLREVLLCLSAQTIGDFEHLIIAHNAAPEAVADIRALIASQSEWTRSRVRFEEVHGGTRTTPLNAGFEMAVGKYVAILDDDDIVFANWLEAFRNIARERPGALLRSVAVRQEFVWANVGGKRSARAVGAMHRDYASTFDYLEHLEVSQTPPVSIAFPRFLFSRHGMHFDESLTTTEDWDYIMRCAARVGVGSAEEITCIYRWWVGAENSRTVHKQSEWASNHTLIQEKIDASVNLLEPGDTKRFREISDKMNEYLRWANKLHGDMMEIQAAADAKDPEQAKQKIAELSRSVQGELTTFLQASPSKTTLLVPPKDDLLPTPRLPVWRRLFAGPAAVAQLRMRRRRETIEASGIFDAQWYLSTYPDVAEQQLDPLTHFINHGSRELRSPSAQFNARSYYATHADLRDHKIEPVFHFVLHGRREGRRFENHA